MDKVAKVLLRSFIVNIFLVVIKISFGIIGRSQALIADGVHSFSDLSTDIVAIIGNKWSKKPADKNHPYGHGNIEYLTSIFIGIFLLYLGISLLSEIFSSKTTVPTNYVAYVVLITIIVKYILASYIIKKGDLYRNRILIASGKESMTDVYSAIGVLGAFLLSKLAVYNNLFSYSDKLAGIIIVFFVLKAGYNVAKENIISILGECEDNEEYIEEVKKIIIECHSNIEIEELYIIKYGSYNKVTATIKINDNMTLKTAHLLIHKIENNLINSECHIKYVDIHINPHNEDIDN